MCKQIKIENNVLLRGLQCFKMPTRSIYTCNGDYDEEEISGDIDVFRKMLDVSKEEDMVEYEIAKKILRCPHPNIVKIYDVVKTDKTCYVDMELLEDRYVPLRFKIDSLRAALQHLHNLNVVYIDIKDDNIGTSISNGEYKLFDFNCSGIVDKNNPKIWLMKPWTNVSCIETYEHMRTM